MEERESGEGRGREVRKDRTGAKGTLEDGDVVFCEVVSLKVLKKKIHKSIPPSTFHTRHFALRRAG